MVKRRVSRPLGWEALEVRQVLDSGVAIGPVAGALARHGPVAEVAEAVAPGHPARLRESRLPGPVGRLAPSDPVLDPRAGAVARDARAVGRSGPTGRLDHAGTLLGDVNGDGRVTLADEEAFVPAFNSLRGDADYLPSADANGNGYVGIGDARVLLRGLAAPGPKVPLKIHVMLSPLDEFHDPSLSVSGGLTRHRDVTILGRTTPGSILFVDEQSNFLFHDGAVVAGPDGHFTLRVHLINAASTIDFLAIDPHGQQYVHALPILLRTY